MVSTNQAPILPGLKMSAHMFWPDGDGPWDGPASPITHWRCTLTYRGERMQVRFRLGLAYLGEPPEVDDVLQRLAHGAYAVDITDGFEKWCTFFGFPPTSKSAKKIYQQMKQHTEGLKRLLGPEYDAVIASYEGDTP